MAANRRFFPGVWMLRLTLVALVTMIGFRMVAHVSVVKGNSMRPTIQDGDRLIVDRLSPRLGQVERFDVVILGNPKNETEDFVKRVVGMPGERVGFSRGRLVINGVVQPEFFTKIVEFHQDCSWQVPPGHFFVVGDNRPVSSDSREFGVVRADLVRGKVRFCLWPLSRVGNLDTE